MHDYSWNDVVSKLETEVDKYTELASSSPHFQQGTQWATTCKIALLLSYFKVIWKHVEAVLQSAETQLMHCMHGITPYWTKCYMSTCIALLGLRCQVERSPFLQIWTLRPSPNPDTHCAFCNIPFLHWAFLPSDIASLFLFLACQNLIIRIWAHTLNNE